MTPRPIVAADAAPRTKASNYPEPFASRVASRLKRPLGDVFGLTSFGVNLEVGDRGAGDEVSYLDDDLQAQLGPDQKWRFLHKDGSAY